MWQDIERRIEENEREGHLPLRMALWEVLRASSLRPGNGATKKMVSFQFGQDERLLWEIQKPARNVFLHHRWQPLVKKIGLESQPRKFVNGMKDGGRHSALGRSWSFGEEDCIAIPLDAANDLRNLLEALQGAKAPLLLKPEAVTRWIARLREFFPDLDRFDRPDSAFDEAERDYKLATSSKLRASLENAQDDSAITHAVFMAATEANNLLDWRTSEPLSAKSSADHARLDPAVASLVHAGLGAPEGHAEALDTFARAWKEAVPKGTEDAARQIGEFVFFHLCPENAVYIRHTVRQDLWLEAVGTAFPKHASLAETYSDEMRFMTAVSEAFALHGLAPRDMIDVQSALWVVHSYSDKELGGTQVLDRTEIETAIDAYDSYLTSGAHSEIFEHFGEPRDYWVRSTRERPNRVYPTKPLVGFILKKKDFSGGWGQKAGAAARLHNAGFIIVDREDTPVSPPEKAAHLIRDADRIRLCALNYFIEPARELGASSVSIRAGDLAKAMGLSDALPNICQALGGEKFQDLAQVPEPTHTEPNPSSTTTFTYQLGSRAETKNLNDISSAGKSTTTNLILYGPPGTGKTYNTAWEAVRLCLGDPAAAELKSDRDALMDHYRRLVREGRIEFVTFHQSLSYEEFVEGLRPSTDHTDGESPGEGAGGSGFQLKCHDGIFKRFSERARLDTGNSGGFQRLDRSARVFKVALGKRYVEDDRIRYGLENGLIHLGWGEDIDWSAERFDEFSEIFSEWRARKNPEASGHDGNIVCTFSFRADMQVGDYVVVSDGRDRIQALGKVAGDYYFEPNAPFHPHRRAVDWLWHDEAGVERDRFYPNGFRRHSVYKLNQSLVDWDALEEIAFGHDMSRPEEKKRDYVLVVDEINRANISKVFGELITLLEADKRLGAQNEVRVQLPYSKKQFGVPANLHIVGTMNTADRSIALLDTALRRRFTFQELMPDPTVLSTNIDGINLRTLLSTINERIEYLFDREHQIGHAYFIGCQTREDVENVMRYKVIPLLAEYFYEDWFKVAAVLGDSPSTGRKHFLDAIRLQRPKEMPEDELNGDKMRWKLLANFDFSEFEA